MTGRAAVPVRVAPNARRTRRRAVVLRALVDSGEFVSAQRLHALMCETGVQIGLTTVYRALRDLEAGGFADVVRDEAGERLYRPRAADGHRHYLICRVCSRSQAVDAEVVERWVRRIAAGTGFAAVEHTVELTGICPGCRR